MNKSLVIRLIQPSEHARLSDIAFRSKAFWGYSAQFMEAARAELLVSADDIRLIDGHYCGAESNSGVCGFYSATRISDKEFELSSLYVEPQHIGKGIGIQLVEHAKIFAHSKGANALFIQSDPNAAGFYIAAGGQIVGERESGSIAGRFLPMIRILLNY